VSSPTPASGRNLRAVFASQGFRRLLGVRLTSQYTDGFFQAGLAGSILFNPDRQARPLAIAVGFAILLLPYSLLGPFVGVFLDRWRRRQVIYRANILRAILVLPAAVLIWANLEGWWFAGLALVIIGINRFFLSGMSAALPLVVQPNRLITANSVAGTLGTVCYSLGLGTSALLLRIVLPTNSHGYAVMAAIATFGYTLAATLAYRLFSIDQLGPLAADRPSDKIGAALVSVAAGMVAGVKHLAARRGAFYALAAQASYRLLYGVLSLSTVLLFRNLLHPGDEDGALNGLFQVVIAGAAGVILAAFITPPITRRIGGSHWLTALLLSASVVVLVLGLQFTALAIVLATFLVNTASQGMKIVVDTSLQRECDDAYRGRVFSVNDTMFNMCWVIGLFIAAVTVPTNGRSVVVVTTIGVGLAVIGLLYAYGVRGWVATSGDDIADRPRPEIREPDTQPAA
jgi:hypothetical protein